MHRGGVDPGDDKMGAARATAPRAREAGTLDWRTVDRALLGIKRSRCALDADEARWLREAEQVRIWNPLGMVSMHDYLERRLAYSPRTAQERMRVARALGALPELTTALANGTFAYSAVRELSRVATPATEAAWIAAATGKSLRQIEELVADHRPGDNPDDPPDPQARTHVVRFELSAETFVLLRQARSLLDDEHGENLADDAFVAALCHGVLDGAPATEPTGRARFQIAMTVCRRCRQGWQEGAGAQIAVGPAAVDRALCDAQHIGSIDGAAPERAYQDIAPSVVRFVWRRDGGRCRIDGCRSARGLELHHIVHRADGGSHDASNLVLACSSCHQAHHAGLLAISGTADRLEVRRFDVAPAHGTHGAAAASFAACTQVRIADGAIGPVSTTSGSASVASPERGRGATRIDAGSEPEQATVAAGGEHRADDVDDLTVAAGCTGDQVQETMVAPERRAHVNTSAAATAGTGHHRGAVTRVTNVHLHGEARTASAATPACRARGSTVAGVIDEHRAHRRVRDDRPARAVATPVSAGARDAHVDAGDKLTFAMLRARAGDALVGLGWKRAVAHRAVADALAAAGGEMTLERLIFESLRRCPVPKA
ncbi:MAG TPA: HNH endonuclease signature motif containing protein [Kofleriaceae bacterium]|nr:HNH endonuclease signature motif containing protein [Kofleriaceae bacterium]